MKFEEEIERVIKQNEEKAIEYVENRDRAALNVLSAELIKETEGEIGSPSEAVDILKEKLKEAYDFDLEWPIEISRTVRVGDETTMQEQLWNKIRDRYELTPSEEEIDSPDRFTVPRIMVDIELHKDGSVYVKNTEVSCEG